MEGTTNGAGDREQDAVPGRDEEEDSGIRTEFERMMFEFNPEENAPSRSRKCPGRFSRPSRRRTSHRPTTEQGLTERNIS